MPECHQCNYECESFPLLAKHIIENSATHGKSLKWALKFNTNAQYLDAKVSRQNLVRVPLTEQEHENKSNCQREISGAQNTARTYCLTCKNHGRQVLPIEFIESWEAWRNDERELIVICPNCRR